MGTFYIIPFYESLTSQLETQAFKILTFQLETQSCKGKAFQNLIYELKTPSLSRSFISGENKNPSKIYHLII